MTYDKQITELVEEIAQLPTLEERMEARNTILGSLHDHRRQFRDQDNSVTKENLMLPFDEIELNPAEIVECYPHMKERMADFEEGYEGYVLLEQMPECPDCLIQNGRENLLNIEILEPNPDGTVFLHLQPIDLCEDCASLAELAVDLATYVSERATVEGVPTELTLEFFLEELRAGVTNFFGVQISDDYDGVPVMVHDTQEPYPGYFDAWMGRGTVH